MPFILYDVAGNHYTRVRTVSIAGNTGPLAAIYRLRNEVNTTPFSWHTPATEIVQVIGGTPAQAILVDLKPKVARNISLYRLLDVWGFSYREWTPLALRLEVFFNDVSHKDPPRFKASFTLAEAKRDFVGEFLYVQGGTGGGTWNWGPVGSVNGALLWRDAFDYLSDQLDATL